MHEFFVKRIAELEIILQRMNGNGASMGMILSVEKTLELNRKLLAVVS